MFWSLAVQTFQNHIFILCYVFFLPIEQVCCCYMADTYAHLYEHYLFFLLLLYGIIRMAYLSFILHFAKWVECCSVYRTLYYMFVFYSYTHTHTLTVFIYLIFENRKNGNSFRITIRHILAAQQNKYWWWRWAMIMLMIVTNRQCSRDSNSCHHFVTSIFFMFICTQTVSELRKNILMGKKCARIHIFFSHEKKK